MRILLTGARGMVGRNLLEHPAVGNYEICAPGRDELDLFRYGDVLAFFRSFRPDLIIHAAGKVGGIHANIRSPVEFLVENFDMGRNVVMAAREIGIPRIINLGSSCMYPYESPSPLTEEAILSGALEPTNEGYALAKISVARLCAYINKTQPKLRYKTLVPCNLYGRFDHFNPNSSHLVAAIIHKLHAAKLAGEKQVEIWGDGNARREFLLASDLADCIWRSAEYFDCMPDLMNVGAGVDYTVNEYYQTAAAVVGYTGKFQHDLEKPVGMRRKLVSVARLSEWGWKPLHDLAAGLKQTYKFYCERISDTLPQSVAG